MNEEKLYKSIFHRKSVRRYDPTPLAEEVLHEIKDNLQTLNPLWEDIKTDIQMIGPEDVNTRMMKKAPHYLAIFSEKKEGYLTNVGFMLQKMDLYFSSQDIGSCWQGIPQIKKNIKNKTPLEFVILMPFGTPTESLHRDPTEFKRKPLHQITNLTGAEDLLEPVRIAPSSTNSQPWYFTGDTSHLQVYCKRPNPLKALFVKKFNKIDMGIALYHLYLSTHHRDKYLEIFIDKEASGQDKPGYDYCCSVDIK